MKHISLAALAAGVLLLAVTAEGHEIPAAAPEDVGLSAERLGRASSRIRADVEAGRIPGAVAMVLRKGKVAYLESFGWADREAEVPMKEDAIFRIFSMSKPVTGVALMMLHEEGKFILRDPVSKFIPEFKNLKVLEEGLTHEHSGMDALLGAMSGNIRLAPRDKVEKREVPVEREMTIQDLMRHTSGLAYGLVPFSSVDRMYTQEKVLGEGTLKDMIGKLSRLPLKHQPGTTWDYSIAVDVQGYLVEVISGQPFDEFLQERIFGPLGMNDTGFYVPEEKWDRLAQVYRPAKGGMVEPGPGMGREDHFREKPSLLSGGGGLVSTIRDYSRFCQMMLNGGELDGVRILGRKTVELMTTDHLGDIDDGTHSVGYGFGLDFAVCTDPTRSGYPGSPGEYFWAGAAGTEFWIDPQEELIGIYMVQILPHIGLSYGRDFKQLVYPAIVD